MQEDVDAGNVTARRSALPLGFAVAVLVYALDRIAKEMFFHPADGGIYGFPEWLVRLTDHHNYGLTFDLPFPRWLLVIVTLSVVSWLVYLLATLKSWRAIEAIAMGLIIGGAMGNLLDRLALGFVRDWLLFFGRSAVNLADGAIVTGALLLLFHHRTET